MIGGRMERSELDSSVDSLVANGRELSSRGEVERLADHDLIRAVIVLAGRARDVTAELLVHLGELDARRLYIAAGCASTFAYCVEVLRMSEPAAYHRITAARAARKFPALVRHLRSGELHLSGVCLLAPVLTEANVDHWIARARGQSKRAIERLLAASPARDPRTAREVRSDATSGLDSGVSVPPSVSSGHLAGARVLAEESGERAGQPGRPGHGERESARACDAADAGDAGDARDIGGRSDRSDGGDAERSQDQAAAEKGGPVSSARVPPRALRDLRVPVDPEFLDLLDAARDLARHRNPSGDLTTLLRLALQALIQQTESRRCGRADAATQGGRSSETPRHHRAGTRGDSVAALRVQDGVVGSPPHTEPEPFVGARAYPPVQVSRSRYIPVAVRREVWRRDGARCAFVAEDGRRCTSRAFLEFHHLVPFALRGEHSVSNLALRCQPHNKYEAELEFELGAHQAFQLSPGGACARQSLGREDGESVSLTSNAAIATRWSRVRS
ncbi:MAG: HNH endonuclease [Candidatus Eisenbacteria bacterium]|nr:HNH endonuclease [Candidatus Eisenbacteria bacterium]